MIKRLKLIFQEGSYDCGISCLLMIARYYNSNVSKDYLEKISMTTNEGTSMYGLMVAATTLGFKCYGKKGNVYNLENKLTPFIAHIKLEENRELYHYVIVNHITKNKITINDPSKGFITMTKDEFKAITTDNYLFIEKTANIKKFTRKKVIKVVWFNLIKENKGFFIILVIFIIISIGLDILNLFSLKIILNNAILVKSFSNLIVLLLIFAYLLFLKTLFSYLVNILILKLSSIFNYHLKTALIKQLLSLPNLYYQTKKKGVVISLFNDINILSEYLFSIILTSINSIFVLSFIYVFFTILSFSLTIILVISMTILFIFIYSQKKISNNLLSKFYLIKDNYNSKLQHVVINNEKIKGLHLEELMAKIVGKSIDCLEEENYNVFKYKAAVKNILNFFEGIIYFLILGISGFLIIIMTNMSLSTFLLLESLIFMALKNAESLILVILKYEGCRKIKERLNDVFNYQKEVLLPFSNYNYVTKNISIIIKNLSFKYADNLILDNINIRIRPKDKVFIYGKSGSGKSTLVKLLGRFLPLSYGHIKLGNIDLTHYNLNDLRNIVTYVSSGEMFSQANIKDNIYLKRKPKINQDILLEMTGIKNMFKEKDYNLNTIIEEGGENLSMGERSRINLAQALFKPSEIYILDECLSNVDIKLEREILENILGYYKDKIIIYISHRLNNKALFNRVFYIKEGKCYEEISK